MLDSNTFLFADLAGFTAHTERHGDEAAARLATALCHHLNGLLPSGAEDVKSLGDACMLRIPNAADAVRFAVTAVETAIADRELLPVRLGMLTGSAVARDRDYFGRTVNRAARIAALAQPNEVLLGAATAAASGHLPGIHFRDAGSHALRGVTEPIQLFSATHIPCWSCGSDAMRPDDRPA